MSTSTNSSKILNPTLSKSLLGSLLGGMVFGMLMQMMNMIKNVAMLVNSQSTAIGWMVHLGISMIFGLTFYIFLTIIKVRIPAPFIGALYGVTLWVVGGLMLMPSKLNMPILNFDSMAIKSLMGHVIFGVILSTVAVRGTNVSSAR